jgi:hypothetical protein
MTITAVITATGLDSSIIFGDSLDAKIYTDPTLAEGSLLATVTLVKDRHGRFSHIWAACPEQWCSDFEALRKEAMRWITIGEFREMANGDDFEEVVESHVEDLIKEIIAAVQAEI